MQLLLIITISLHVLAGVFWVGTTLALARTGGLGGEQLFRPQMGAAVVAFVTGGYLWHLLHPGVFGTAEKVLATGAFTAVIAAGVQGAMVGPAVRRLRQGVIDTDGARPRIASGQRVAAVLLAITVLCMAAARYA